MDKPAFFASLAIVQPKTSTEVRVPLIVDDNFLPDMGRMFG